MTSTEIYKFIFAAVVCILTVAALMSVYKLIWYLITKKDTIVVLNQIIAWVCSYVAVVLSWWALSVPEQFIHTFLYMFPVYTLQKVVDLKMIKKIIENRLSK